MDNLYSLQYYVPCMWILTGTRIGRSETVLKQARCSKRSSGLKHLRTPSQRTDKGTKGLWDWILL